MGLLFAVGAVLTGTCAGAEEVVGGVAFETENHVLVLKEDTFAQALQKLPTLMVEFYAPWCSHCKRFAPDYEKAAKKLKKIQKQLKKSEPAVRLAKIDATTEWGTKVSKEHNIVGYPSLLGFRNGQPHGIYNGLKERDDIVDYMSALEGNTVLYYPRYCFVLAKGAFKLLARELPIGKDTRKFLYRMFPGILVLGFVMVLLFAMCIWKCCSGTPSRPKVKAKAKEKDAMPKPNDKDDEPSGEGMEMTRTPTDGKKED